jgi:alpha-1,3-fucosyltransferase 10
LGTILVWNDAWNMAGPARGLAFGGWSLTHDRWQAPLADAIVFHLPTLAPADLPTGRRPGQRWVAWSMESEVNYPALVDPAFRARIDLEMSYRRSADVWTPYLRGEDALLAPASPKTEAAPCVYVASNARDASGRHAYVGALMRHIAVDAWGECLRNRRWDRDDGRTTKLATIARYRFTLAFENSIASDYVTEKFFDALAVGSVPVVLGAPNVADYAPAPDAFVDVRDFDGPASLARHLAALARDEPAYARALAWKTDGIGASLRAMLADVAVDPWTRLARRLGSGSGSGS